MSYIDGFVIAVPTPNKESSSITRRKPAVIQGTRRDAHSRVLGQ